MHFAAEVLGAQGCDQLSLSLAVVVRLLPNSPSGEAGLPVLLQDGGNEEEVDGAV